MVRGGLQSPRAQNSRERVRNRSRYRSLPAGSTLNLASAGSPPVLVRTVGSPPSRWLPLNPLRPLATHQRTTSNGSSRSTVGTSLRWMLSPHSSRSLGGIVLPRAEQAAAFLDSHREVIIVPETRQAKEWLVAIADSSAQAVVIVPLHEHTIPEHPDTPNEIIGGLPPSLRSKLTLEIRYSPTPALVSNPAISTATTSPQCFRWASARYEGASSSWAGPALEGPLEGLIMAIPRGAQEVDKAAAFALRQIEKGRAEQVCAFASPRHTFLEVYGLDHDTAGKVHTFPETRTDFLVEDLPWLYQSGEGWSFYFQRALRFSDFASPSIFGKSFPVSNTHLRSRGPPSLKTEEMLALIWARNRGSANPVVAALNHGSSSLHIFRNPTPPVAMQQSEDVAVVCGFPKHLPLTARATILKQVLPSVTSDCWLGNSPARAELKGGCFFLPPRAWSERDSLAEARRALSDLGLTLLHPAPAHSKSRPSPTPRGPDPPTEMPCLPPSEDKLTALRKIFTNAGVELPAYLGPSSQAPRQSAVPLRQGPRHHAGAPGARARERAGKRPSPRRRSRAEPDRHRANMPPHKDKVDSEGGRPQAHTPEGSTTIPVTPTPEPLSSQGENRGASKGDSPSPGLTHTTKKRRLHQPTIQQCLRRGGPRGAGGTSTKLPGDIDLTKVHDLRRNLVSSQEYTKAFQTHSQAGTKEKVEERRASFLSKDCEGSTTSTFGGDVEISAYALTRNLACRVWVLQNGTIHPHQEVFACTGSAKKDAHFLFSRSANPEKSGEFLRNGHFDLLLPEEDLPQGLSNLQKFCPQNSPPLFRVPCPQNGHCLFAAMAFLDNLLTPSIVDGDQGEISDDEVHILELSTESDLSSDSTFCN